MYLFNGGIIINDQSINFEIVRELYGILLLIIITPMYFLMAIQLISHIFLLN